MSTSCRRLDDVALWSILKAVDASTLQNCRRVSTKWNGEILRLNDYTSKFNPDTLILELAGSKFKVSVGTPNAKNGSAENLLSSETVRTMLCHVASPKTLLIYLSQDTDMEGFEVMMSGIKDNWISNVQELEIVSHNPDLSISEVLQYLKKIPNLTYFSLSHHCNEIISIGDIFESLCNLKQLRIFGFNSNDGSSCSSGLIFDDEAVKQLLRNQNGCRKFQNLELYNTDITVSSETLTDFWRRMARLPSDVSDPQNENRPKNSEAETVNLLFDNCRWNSLDELDLLSDIIRMASRFDFPIQQPDDNILKGDFQFSIFETHFVLKLMSGN
ncbi:hypothetical protein B9Z55_005346 [Caenorhabditis nigoni]|uniref:F-box domain-containing protein n=1 Tax=Caenorhabditis nigoni TaxID=1611254 RepID=A0A2G5V0J1_9PELO|nr:hypothetical protein B9Z55_005346 [Caenorhabditis nigoni]